MKKLEKDWITSSGLRAVVLIVYFDKRQHHRCGYVGVPVNHPFHGKGYSEQLPEISTEATQVPIGKKSFLLALTAGVNSDGPEAIRRSLDVAVDVHGGLTYADGSANYPVDNSDNLWWFGFDCAHYRDAPIEPGPNDYNDPEASVKTLEYVMTECENLAKGIQKFAYGKEPL